MIGVLLPSFTHIYDNYNFWVKYFGISDWIKWLRVTYYTEVLIRKDHTYTQPDKCKCCWWLLQSIVHNFISPNFSTSTYKLQNIVLTPLSYKYYGKHVHEWCVSRLLGVNLYIPMKKRHLKIALNCCNSCCSFWKKICSFYLNLIIWKGKMCQSMLTWSNGYICE